MALFGKIDDSYTSTGKNSLSSASSTLSFLPGFIRNFGGDGGFLSKIPFIGGSITAVLGYAGTIYEAGQWLFEGKIGSAATVLATGALATTVNAASDTVAWWVNGISGVATGASIGTHARAGMEVIIGSVTAAIGSKPDVLIPGGPGKHATIESYKRGENPDEAYARFASGEGGVHINELQSANGRGA